MLKYIKENKSCIVWVVTFGIGGLLLAPAVAYIIKLSKHYPKIFHGITVGIMAFICIYGFAGNQEWELRFAPIGICALVSLLGCRQIGKDNR